MSDNKSSNFLNAIKKYNDDVIVLKEKLTPINT